MHLSDTAAHWERFGQTDPLWAILTNENGKNGRWDVERFYETGRVEIRRALAALEAADALPAPGRALDFGCGAGRLTVALVQERFAAATGVDVAPSMLALARQRVAGTPLEQRTRFVHNEHPDLRGFDDCQFDFVLSSIVLQHMRPAFQLRYLSDMCRVLRPGGVLFVQTPDHHVSEPRAADGAQDTVPVPLPGAHALVDEPDREPEVVDLGFVKVTRGVPRDRGPVMEVWGIARRLVEDALRANGMSIVSVSEDGSCGPNYKSWRYVARRR